MALQLSTSDKRLLLRGWKGNARDILNDGQANFILAMLRRQFRDVGGFASLTYKNKGLYWEEEEKLQRCIFKFRISGKEIKFYTDAQAEQILLRQTHTSSVVRKGVKAAKKAGEEERSMKYLDAFMDVRPDEDNSFRFILSPEHSRGVPFVDFTRQ